MMDQYEINFFEELFYRDLESWFSADIACCDYCYDEFIGDWPRAYSAEDARFQKNGIPLSAFYSGSRLQQHYTEERFSELIKQINCPRCLAPLEHNIWAYELPVSVPNDFASNVSSLVRIAAQTPFLLLDNIFCREILAAIKELASRSIEREFKNPLYRARQTSSSPIAHKIEEFETPPKELVSEGRYNHSGAPVLYIASDMQTCRAEMRGAACTMAEFILTRKLHVLDLTDPYEQHRGHDDLLNSLVYSALLSAKQSDHGQFRPHYVVSRFVADCAKHSGFQAIMYPSTRASADSFNIVILDSAITLESHARAFSYHDFDVA